VKTRAFGILQVTTHDIIGGAGRIAWNLFQSYRARGYGSWLAVGEKLGDDPDVVPIPSHQRHRGWPRFWWDVETRFQSLEPKFPAATVFRDVAHAVAEPAKALNRYRGIEEFGFPGTGEVLASMRDRADVVHCHNLHGGFFDLRVLPRLSQQVPVVLTLHDAWLLSGHCAHSFDCERWKTGCGHCPDLTIDPAIRRDATAHNWRLKREIFKESQLYVATPSRWLMHKVEQSMLATAVKEAQVIPNGVDLSVFRPGDQKAARAALGIRSEARVILSAAYALRRNIWKDYHTLRQAVALTAERLDGQDVVFLALGEEDGGPDRIGPAEVHGIPHQTDPAAVARCYQAADAYVHAARADTFPTTVLEALACGTPVVATGVGGIPEQVEDARTGFLVPSRDPKALADRLTHLLSDGSLRQRMAQRAVETARREFDLDRQVDAYLGWYHELVNERRLNTFGEPQLACAAQP
jgi:glycosyltransferase involved in cell wall biosynthesis